MKLPLLITGNLSLKVVSVVMASLFWLYVMAEMNTEKRVQVPVSLVNLDESLAVVDKPPVSLEVDIAGSRLDLLTLPKDSLKLVLDLSGVREGSVSFSHLEKVVIADSRLRVTRVYPARIEISVARTGADKTVR